MTGVTLGPLSKTRMVSSNPAHTLTCWLECNGTYTADHITFNDWQQLTAYMKTHGYTRVIIIIVFGDSVLSYPKEVT